MRYNLSAYILYSQPNYTPTADSFSRAGCRYFVYFGAVANETAPCYFVYFGAVANETAPSLFMDENYVLERFFHSKKID
jgi:hypothetical protein